jgi:hypothetical protein
MRMMKVSLALLGVTLLAAASAFAGNTNKKSMHLNDNVMVSGTQLMPGDYKVEWSGSGPKVKLNFMEGRDLVASAPARVVSETHPNEEDGYGVKKGKDGRNSLTVVFFSGAKYQLEIQPS